MAVTIVATVGSATANAFVTRAELDTYLEARFNASAATGASTANRDIAIIEATRDISVMAFQGYRVDETQALSWPRSSALNPDTGTYYDEDVIPQRVKDATCELAMEALKAGTTDIFAQDSKQNVIQKTVGPLSTTYSDPSARTRGIARYPRVMDQLSPLLGIGSNQVRLTR